MNHEEHEGHEGKHQDFFQRLTLLSDIDVGGSERENGGRCEWHFWDCVIGGILRMGCRYTQKIVRSLQIPEDSL